mmetsp:Transcript_42033/g.111052  ORF Transcript_42033/g.111052 Transcript_42033/m.111052 type:complete len:162 (-) Transcript_42033:19-504(-)
MSARAALVLAACLALAALGDDAAAPCADAVACAALRKELAADDGGLELRQLRAERQPKLQAGIQDLEARLVNISSRILTLEGAREEVEAAISRKESVKYETTAGSDPGSLKCGDIYCAGNIGSHCCWGNLPPELGSGPYSICCGSTGRCSTGPLGYALCKR